VYYVFEILILAGRDVMAEPLSNRRDLPSSAEAQPTGEVFSRASEGQFNFVYRRNQNGTERQKVMSDPILNLDAISPRRGCG
jgi:hypothetical protein